MNNLLILGVDCSTDNRGLLFLAALFPSPFKYDSDSAAPVSLLGVIYPFQQFNWQDLKVWKSTPLNVGEFTNFKVLEFKYFGITTL